MGGRSEVVGSLCILEYRGEKKRDSKKKEEQEAQEEEEEKQKQENSRTRFT